MFDSVYLPYAAGAAAAALGAVALSQLRSKKQQQLPFPPGPKGIPVLGNALQLPPQHAWLQFSEWSKQYGDVIWLTALGRGILVLNSQEAVNDLLIKRGVNYSDRPVLIMCSMCGWDNTWGLLRYGERLRTTRRLASRVLNPRACQQHVSTQESAVKRFLVKMANNPDKLIDNTRWLAACIILKVVYDYDMKDDGLDRLVEINKLADATFSHAASPGWLVDIFPSLRHLPEWLPGAGFARLAKVYKKRVDAMYDVPFDMVKKAMADGTTSSESHSFAATLLSGEDGKGVTAEEMDIIRIMTGSMYGAAGETTSVSVQAMVLAMILNPEVQRRAHEEIEQVTGGDRLPTYEDRSKMPYMEALLKEIHRWNPVVAGGLAHCTSGEDEYRGWRIPAETIVMPNIWHLTHDPAVYPDPFAFKPERYLDGASNGELNPDPTNFTFGFGRRECPGRHLADASIWLAVTMFLASFNIKNAKDEHGVDIIPSVKYSGGVLTHPEDFPYAIEPRSAHAKAWLRG